MSRQIELSVVHDPPIEVLVSQPARTVEVSQDRSSAVLKASSEIEVEVAAVSVSADGPRPSLDRVEVPNPSLEVVASIGARGPRGASADEVSIVVSSMINGRRAVTHDGTYCDADDLDSLQAYAGITTHAAETGASVLVRRFGELEDSGLVLEADMPVFVGSEGRLVQSAPDFALCVGFATSPTSIALGVRQIVMLAA